MLRRTAELKNAVARSNDIFEKLRLLRGAYEGETGYIICCGPSLLNYERARLKAYLADKLVFAVKQAFTFLNEESDFHILHHSNAQRYDYSGCSAIVLDEDEGCGFSQPDVLFPKLPSNLYASVSLHRNFDDYLLEQTPIRPCGPGILYEIGLYLGIHLGLRRLVIVGWDLYSSPEQLQQLMKGQIGQTHYYEQDWRKYASWHDTAVSDDSLSARLERFRKGEIINTLQYVPADDIVLTAAATPAIWKWAESHGMSLFRTAQSANVTSKIPVVDLYLSDSNSYLDSHGIEADTVRSTPEFEHLRQLRVRELNVTARDARLTVGWHGVEHDGKEPFRWSGPGTTSYLPVPLDRTAVVNVEFRMRLREPDDQVHIIVDGVMTETRAHMLENGELRLQAVIPARPQAPEEIFTIIKLQTERLFQPCQTIEGSEDGRWLGFVFYAVLFKAQP